MFVRAARLFLSLLLGVAGTARAADDFQLWAEVGVEAPVAQDVHLGARSELRFTDDSSRLGLYNWNVGVAYGWNTHSLFALEFLQEYVPQDDHLPTENRLEGSETWVDDWRGITFSDRNQFEGRFFTDGEDRFRYRNRIQVVPLALWGRRVHPFISEEIFVESAGRGFDQLTASRRAWPWRSGRRKARPTGTAVDGEPRLDFRRRCWASASPTRSVAR